MVFQTGVILVSTMETSCKTAGGTSDNALFTMVSKFNKPVLAVNFLKQDFRVFPRNG